MATEIVLPALAPGMTEGTLSLWLKKPGDEVKAGDPIAEIETDKAIVELEAVDGGVLAEILVQEGTGGVKVDTAIARLASAGETAAGGTADAVAASRAPAAHEQMAATVVPISTVSAGLPAEAARSFASPLARRLAREHDLELTALTGTGPRGRIVRADIERALTAGDARVAAPAPAVVPMIASASRPTAADAPREGDWEDVPHTSMRRVIAQRLTEAKREIPHFYLTVECKVDALLALRKQINEAMQEDEKITVNDFIVKAVALALKKVPDANVAWTENAIRRFRTSDVSVAVSTPGGLITPIVRRAEQKSLGAISSEIRELAGRARLGRLLPQEYQGGSFTVSNLGMHGIREFAAIINPPQACILAVGVAEQRPVVVDGALGIATVMTCTVSADHRAVDGSVGAAFLAAFRHYLEKPHAILV